MAQRTWNGERDICIGVPRENGAPFTAIYKLDLTARTAQLVEPDALMELPHAGIFQRGLGFIADNGELVVTSGVQREVKDSEWRSRWQEVPRCTSRFQIIEAQR